MLTGCPKEPARQGSTPPGKDADPAVVVAAPPAAFRPAKIQMVSAAIKPATLDWDKEVITRMELEEAIEDGEVAVSEARNRLARFVVSFDHGDFDPYDAATGTLVFRAHGLEGMDLDPPVTFVGSPSVTVGSLPGPVGGSVSLRVSEMLATMTIDAAGAAAVAAVEATDPIMTQYLLELSSQREFEGATVVDGYLYGVRLVRLGSREVFLDGEPAKPLR